MSIQERRRQDRLRALVQQVTLPQVKLSSLAAEAKLSPVTVGKFIRGHGITDEQERSLADALLRLLPETKK